MMGEDEIRCSGRILTEIFTEDKLVLIYRFSLEIEKARQMFEQTRRGVVNLDGDDVQMDEIERELCTEGKNKLDKPQTSGYFDFLGNGKNLTMSI